MSMLDYDVFEAFKSAGADEEKARKAAVALAGGQEHVAKFEAKLAKIETKLDFHSWVLGTVIALNVAILIRLLIAS